MNLEQSRLGKKKCPGQCTQMIEFICMIYDTLHAYGMTVLFIKCVPIQQLNYDLKINKIKMISEWRSLISKQHGVFNHPIQ